MWMPAMAGCPARTSVRAQAANVSSEDVMSVGRKRVTPVFPIAATARRTSSGRGRRVAEVDAGEAVDLQVDESRQLQRPGAERQGPPSRAGRRACRVAAAEPEAPTPTRHAGAREEPRARRVGLLTPRIVPHNGRA